MSFMFHPYPYADPDAVNVIDMPQSVIEGLTCGVIPTAKKLMALIEEGKTRIGIDHYPGAHVEQLIHCMVQQAYGKKIMFVDAACLLKCPEDITAMLKPYLPEDRTKDPVLLYGVRYLGGYSELQDSEKVENLKQRIACSEIPIVVYGQGALSEALWDSYDIRVWMDVTPRTAVLNYKHGHFTNLGSTEALTYNLMMRRNYYVDFETAMTLRWNLIRARKMDYYISADVPENMQMLDTVALIDLFETLNARPFRCRPVYLEGVWGGYYLHRLRNLPKGMRNCAWVFDMIPLEVSIVAKMGKTEFEAPFFTFVQFMGEKLLGKQAFNEFGGYFPIRFNYDDTWHSSGNMSIQCHPTDEYVRTNHEEFGRQDESYYICVASHDAKTFLGFVDENSCDEFFREARRVENTKELIDYEKYINAVSSIPGTQVMIPAGTVHASGRNQVILEIGSLTVGSYTYKLYDYQRSDPQTGTKRPIHLKMASDVIHGERTREWVEKNLVNHGEVVREGNGWKEIIVGEHDLLYFSLRNLMFWETIEDNTDGFFHVLSLVDGEKVRVESIEDPQRYYDMNYLDIVVIPATLGQYRIVNRGVGKVTIHKTMLKKH